MGGVCETERGREGEICHGIGNKSCIVRRNAIFIFQVLKQK